MCKIHQYIKKSFIGKTTNKYIGGFSMIRKSYFIVIVLITFFSLNQSVFAVNIKQSNQEQTLSADEFYKTIVDKQRYEEF